MPRALERGRASGAQFAVLGEQGVERPLGAGLLPHAWSACGGHAVLEQLRAVSVSREGDSTLRVQPAGGLTVPLYGDGLNVRDWLHVDDHCRGIQLVQDGGRPGEVYNIGGGLELTNRELTERLLEACGADWSSVRLVEDRKGHDRRYSVDWSKISDELGYQPSVGFDDGLADVVAWYRSNRTWWEPLKHGATGS